LRARAARATLDANEALEDRPATAPMTTNFGSPPGGQGQGHGGRPAEGSYLIPAGMPPGAAYMNDERPPEGVYYFRIYGGFMTVLSALATLVGLVMMFMPLFVRSATGTDPGTWLVGLVYGGVGIAFFVPWVIALFGDRKPWVHTLGTVMIALGMTQLCCLPIQIPLLIAWLKPETKRWYSS
jgi:hypothetical protein